MIKLMKSVLDGFLTGLVLTIAIVALFVAVLFT